MILLRAERSDNCCCIFRSAAEDERLSSPEGSRRRTPSPSVDEAPSPQETMDKPQLSASGHHHHGHHQTLPADDAMGRGCRCCKGGRVDEDLAGLFAHVKWIYDVELLNVILEEVEMDPQLEAMVMGEGESDGRSFVRSRDRSPRGCIFRTND